MTGHRICFIDPSSPPNAGMDLSIIEQSPRLRSIYTQLCLCYPVSDNASHTAIIEVLTSGLERLTVNFPWLAGHVVNTSAADGSHNTHIFKIQPFERLPHLVIKDLTSDRSFPLMAELIKADFPFGMLDERVICPRTTLGEAAGESSSDPVPVLLLQANFTIGGLLLTILASHSTMDIVGQIQVIHLLSKACGDEPFTDDEVSNGNLDRRNLIPLLEQSWKPEPKSSSQIEQPISSQSHPMDDTLLPIPASLTWAYFTFPSISLAALKRHATSSSSTPLNFVSTDDALCAIIWQSIARARLIRSHPATNTVFTRAVDMRRHLNIPNTYLGNMVTKTTNKSTLQNLADEPLDVIASQLRSKLDPAALTYSIRAQATIQTRFRDEKASSPVDRSQYVVMSSWSKANCYDVDFNLGLGVPKSVRRPRFEPVEGVVYLLPKAPDGETVAGLCLREDDMMNLREDEEFARYTRYIG